MDRYGELEIGSQFERLGSKAKGVEISLRAISFMLTQDVLSSFDLTLTLSFEKERELFC